VICPACRSDRTEPGATHDDGLGAGLFKHYGCKACGSVFQVFEQSPCPKQGKGKKKFRKKYKDKPELLYDSRECSWEIWDAPLLDE
jgi:transposase-like protein